MNDFSFLQGVIHKLHGAGINTWVFGGWAEELRGLRPPGPHQDIDLLYAGENFKIIDRYLEQALLKEVRAKRFSHKRAFVLEGILVELLLVQGQGGHYWTQFFDGRCRLEWPEETFLEWSGSGITLPVAGRSALVLYRARHDLVKQAYRDSLQ